MGIPSHGSNLVALQSRRSQLAVQPVNRRQRREGSSERKIKGNRSPCHEHAIRTAFKFGHIWFAQECVLRSVYSVPPEECEAAACRVHREGKLYLASRLG